MSYTSNNDLEIITSGAADWDTSVNNNTYILDRGLHCKFTAAENIVPGRACSLTGAGTVAPTNPNSLATAPHCISVSSVTSGSVGVFLIRGLLRSTDAASGVNVREPAFVSAASPGIMVGSFAGHGASPGVLVDSGAFHFAPFQYFAFPNNISVSVTGSSAVGSPGDFSMVLGTRGIVYELTASGSLDRYKIQIWSNSTRANSELIYETLTRSLSTGSADVASTYFRDTAPFTYRSTNTNTPTALFGRVTVQSGNTLTGAVAYTLNVVAERFR